MSQEKVTFRLWNDSDEEGILALVRHGYGDLEISHADFFDWEYRRNPAGRAIICCGQLTDGTIVSALAVTPVPVLFKGTAMTAGVLVNGVTHPDFRGEGLFPECGKLVCETLGKSGIALSYGLPNPNSYPGLTRKVGFTDIGRACLLIRLHALAPLLAIRFSAARWLGLGGFDRMLVRRLQRKPGRMMDVRAISTFEGIHMARLREEAKLVVNISAEWLNWRYLNVPRRRYFLVVAGEETKPAGVAVYQITSWDDVRIGTVNDLFLAPDCGPDVVESLMYHVFSECEASGCAATFCVVSPASRKLEMLRHAGFWIVPSSFEPQPFPVILQGHTVSISGITVEDMEVSFGVYDIF